MGVLILFSKKEKFEQILKREMCVRVLLWDDCFPSYPPGRFGVLVQQYLEREQPFSYVRFPTLAQSGSWIDFCVNFYELCVGNCRRTALLVLFCLRPLVGRDVAGMIAKLVYETRANVILWSGFDVNKKLPTWDQKEFLNAFRLF